MIVIAFGGTWWLSFAMIPDGVVEGALGSFIGAGVGACGFIRGRHTLTRENVGGRVLEVAGKSWFGALIGLALAALTRGWVY